MENSHHYSIAEIGSYNFMRVSMLNTKYTRDTIYLKSKPDHRLFDTQLFSYKLHESARLSLLVIHTESVQCIPQHAYIRMLHAN